MTSASVRVHLAGLVSPNADRDFTDRPNGIKFWQINLFHKPMFIGPSRDNNKTFHGPSVYIFRPKTPQYYTSLDGAYSDDWMCLDGDVDSILKKYKIPANKGFLVTNVSALERCIRDIYQEWKEQPLFHQDACNDLINQFFRLLARGRRSCGSASALHYEEILKVREKLSKSFDREWSVPEMALLVGLSENRFSYLYKKYCGTSPQKDLTGFRMHRAMELLQFHPNLDVSDVSELCGYQDPLYFSRVFKRFHGRTPSSVQNL